MINRLLLMLADFHTTTTTHWYTLSAKRVHLCPFTTALLLLLKNNGSFTDIYKSLKQHGVEKVKIRFLNDCLNDVLRRGFSLTRGWKKKNERHKTWENLFFFPLFCRRGYSTCLSSLLFPWWQTVFSSPSFFSVIQTPLPLPVDKVRTETCVLLLSRPVCMLFVPAQTCMHGPRWQSSVCVCVCVCVG